MKGIAMTGWCVRALRNTRPDVWPAAAVNASKPLKWQTRRIITPQAKHHEAGDLIYVKECLFSNPNWRAGEYAQYCADNAAVGHPSVYRQAICGMLPWRWKRKKLPAMFMPREAARIFLEVKAVRAQKLQDISSEDCLAEGLPSRCVEEFHERWNELNAKRDCAWETNPGVWIYELMQTGSV